MPVEARLGRVLFAAAFIALGLESLLLHIYVMRLEPMPAAAPAYGAYVSGAILVALGIGILIDRWARLAALLLAGVLLLWTLSLHLLPLLAKPFSPLWTGTFECFALFGAAWVLAGLLPVGATRNVWDGIAERGSTLGRLCFGVALPVFGATHFIYHDFVASYIPAWIPYRLFFAYFTGTAHAAAGVAILTRIWGRLAATLLALMYGSWVLILHIPRVMAAPHDPFEWNGVFVASALCAGAFLVAASFAKGEKI